MAKQVSSLPLVNYNLLRYICKKVTRGGASLSCGLAPYAFHRGRGATHTSVKPVGDIKEVSALTELIIVPVGAVSVIQS